MKKTMFCFIDRCISFVFGGRDHSGLAFCYVSILLLVGGVGGVLRNLLVCRDTSMSPSVIPSRMLNWEGRTGTPLKVGCSCHVVHGPSGDLTGRRRKYTEKECQVLADIEDECAAMVEHSRASIEQPGLVAQVTVNGWTGRGQRKLKETGQLHVASERRACEHKSDHDTNRTEPGTRTQDEITREHNMQEQVSKRNEQ